MCLCNSPSVTQGVEVNILEWCVLIKEGVVSGRIRFCCLYLNKEDGLGMPLMVGPSRGCLACFWFIWRMGVTLSSSSSFSPYINIII